MNSLSVRNLCFFYREPKQSERIVLDHANLEVRRKEILCICGQSGMGKSTLLRILGGLAKPDCGEIYYAGVQSPLSMHNALQVAKDHRVAFVFQNSALISNLSVFDNIALPLRYHHPRMAESEVRRQVENLLVSMMVQEYQGLMPYALSAGVLRRVAIARSLALEPSILLMDEPTAGIDARNRRSLLALIDNQRSLRHATIVMVTHDLHIVRELDSRVCFLHQGKLSSPVRYEEFSLIQDEDIRDMIVELEQQAKS